MRRFRMALIVVVLSMISCYAHAAGMSVVNERYFADASGTPRFLIGYQDYAMGSTMVNYKYVISDVLDAYVPYGLNYLRTLVAQPQYRSDVTPDGSTSRTPFLYQGGRVNLDQWDATFWNNLKADIAQAAANGVFMHLTVFDGVGLRGDFGDVPFGWGNADWNVNNQTQSFFGNIDGNSDGDAEDDGEFCNASAFNNNTGVGNYQKRLIDKLMTETSSYPNVFYEVGNEMSSGSCPQWSATVRNYMITKTSKPVTINTCTSGGGCTMPSSTGGWVQHWANTSAQVKEEAAAMTGRGYPAMEDPDGPDLYFAGATELRQAAWYSLTGGASGWGGFTSDMWYPTPNAINTTKLTYYGYLLSFLSANNVRFWEMTPQHSLISNNTYNSLLAKTGSSYLGYVLSGATVDITLGTGTYSVKYFNPVTGVTTSGTDTTGPAARTFSRPTGASDWVVFVSNTALSGKPVAPSMVTVK